MKKEPVFDVFMCTLTFAITLWMLTIIFSVSNKTKDKLHNNLSNIPHNSSCITINATLFKYENLMCDNQLSISDSNIKCYQKGKSLINFIYKVKENSSKPKGVKVKTTLVL